MAGKESSQDTILRLGRASIFLSEQERVGDLGWPAERAKETLLHVAMIWRRRKRPHLATPHGPHLCDPLFHHRPKRHPKLHFQQIHALVTKEILEEPVILMFLERHM